jgi:hypothetical protein
LFPCTVLLARAPSPNAAFWVPLVFEVRDEVPKAALLLAVFAPSEKEPKATLRDPLTLLPRLWNPNAALLSPSWFSIRADFPTAEFWSPVVLVKSDQPPTVVLWRPVVLLRRARNPTPELPTPVVVFPARAPTNRVSVSE